MSTIQQFGHSENRKEEWDALWNDEKEELLTSLEWLKGFKYGKPPNPEKSHYLKLVPQVARHVNTMKDMNGLSYARKSIILSALGLDVCVNWKLERLFPHLQDTITMNTCHLKYEPVTPLVIRKVLYDIYFNVNFKNNKFPSTLGCFGIVK